MPNSNRSQTPPMAPHGIYAAADPSPDQEALTPDPSPNSGRGEPNSTVVTRDSPPQRLGEGPGEGWIAIACRNDDDWRALSSIIDESWTEDARFATVGGRLEHEDDLDSCISLWASSREPHALSAQLQAAGVPATVVQSPEQRIDQDPNTNAWGLWPEVEHSEMGTVRVDGIPAHLSETDWRIARGAPCLGEHNDGVFGTLLGVNAGEIGRLHAEGVL